MSQRTQMAASNAVMITQSASGKFWPETKSAVSDGDDPPIYRLVQLGPDGTLSGAIGINNNGQVEPEPLVHVVGQFYNLVEFGGDRDESIENYTTAEMKSSTAGRTSR